MRRLQWVGAVMVVVALSLLVFRLGHQPSAAPPAARQSPDSSPSMSSSTPTQATTMSPAPKMRQRVSPSEGSELTIPGVLSAPFGEAISPDEDNALNPPTYTQVYRWAERGLPGCPSRDTVFLLGHTVRAGGGVFDRLQEVTRGQDIVLMTKSGEIRYEVVSTKLYDKDEIAQEQEVYAPVPGRLVLVGCFLNPDGSLQTKNFVVIARSVSC